MKQVPRVRGSGGRSATCQEIFKLVAAGIFHIDTTVDPKVPTFLNVMPPPPTM